MRERSTLIKKRSFWIGLAIGILIGFLYGWLSIWATYKGLERANREREAELAQIKKIIFHKEDILQQRREILEWNLKHIQPVPEWATEEGNQ